MLVAEGMNSRRSRRALVLCMAPHAGAWGWGRFLCSPMVELATIELGVRADPPSASCSTFTLENLMQLIKSTPTRGEDGENIYTDEVVMISNDPDMLRAKAHDLCQGMRIKPEPWCSRYPVMGNNEVQSDHEWVMTLSNGIGFIIEK